MTLTTKGQVTIPLEIRQALGLLPGTRVAFDIVGNSVRIRKAGDQSRGAALVARMRAARFDRIEDLEAALTDDYLLRQPVPWEAAFHAGRSFVRYRRKGGQRRSPPPDSYIGAHALVARFTLLTRDPRRCRSYFPALRVIAPQGRKRRTKGTIPPPGASKVAGSITGFPDRRRVPLQG